MLGAYGVWMAFSAYTTHSICMGIVAGLLFVAAVGTQALQRWSSFLEYAFASVLTFQWLRVVGTELLSGAFISRIRGVPPVQVILMFVPAIIMFSLTGYCCYVAQRYVRGHAGRS
jgi:hypothetical protein